jgi:hypothetical protein
MVYENGPIYSFSHIWNSSPEILPSTSSTYIMSFFDSLSLTTFQDETLTPVVPVAPMLSDLEEPVPTPVTSLFTELDIPQVAAPEPLPLPLPTPEPTPEVVVEAPLPLPFPLPTPDVAPLPLPTPEPTPEVVIETPLPLSLPLPTPEPTPQVVVETPLPLSLPLPTPEPTPQVKNVFSFLAPESVQVTEPVPATQTSYSVSLPVTRSVPAPMMQFLIDGGASKDYIEKAHNHPRHWHLKVQYEIGVKNHILMRLAYLGYETTHLSKYDAEEMRKILSVATRKKLLEIAIDLYPEHKEGLAQAPIENIIDGLNKTIESGKPIPLMDAIKKVRLPIPSWEELGGNDLVAPVTASAPAPAVVSTPVSIPFPDVVPVSTPVSASITIEERVANNSSLKIFAWVQKSGIQQQGIEVVRTKLTEITAQNGNNPDAPAVKVALLEFVKAIYAGGLPKDHLDSLWNQL